jgi:hypothetical protein
MCHPAWLASTLFIPDNDMYVARHQAYAHPLSWTITHVPPCTMRTRILPSWREMHVPPCMKVKPGHITHMPVATKPMHILIPENHTCVAECNGFASSLPLMDQTRVDKGMRIASSLNTTPQAIP